MNHVEDAGLKQKKVCLISYFSLYSLHRKFVKTCFAMKISKEKAQQLGNYHNGNRAEQHYTMPHFVSLKNFRCSI